MKVTQVALRPTDASCRLGRPHLTPELLAAVGARYSRNNEGLDEILEKVSGMDSDKAVDSIFKMVDYGHASIADMAPVAMFIDGLSIFLAYYVWSLVPTAGGQESSTRYIKLSADELIDPKHLGIPAIERAEWKREMERAFESYQLALSIWEKIATDQPELMRIPQSLLESTDEKDKKKVARLKRNYAFDRARYFLPVAAATNMMLVMNARGWVQLAQHLISHYLPEARDLGVMIREELELVTPRLTKHACFRESEMKGIQDEFNLWRSMATREVPYHLRGGQDRETDAPPAGRLQIFEPYGWSREEMARALQFHENRYAWTGTAIRRCAVRFSWDAVAMAEIRDLNRHRTGTKWCPLVPQGFYWAEDQLPEPNASLKAMAVNARSTCAKAYRLLCDGDRSYMYWTLLGTQFPFEHTTTLDKFIYEAELRTGVGAHFRYAEHLRSLLGLLYEQHPELEGKVLEGSAEPE